MKPRKVFARTRPATGYRIAAAVDDEVDVMLYDEIGYWGIEAKPFIQELQALDVSTIHLHVNSPGGDVFAGIAIANALRALDATVITHIDALAASIASVIALAGDEVRIADNAFLMIHEAWTVAIGNSTDLRKSADLLDKIGGSITDAYVKKTGASIDQVNAWMADETWFSAAEALAEGFVDAVDAQSETTADFDLSVFAHAPAALLQGASREPSERDLERVLRDAGLSRVAAKAVLSGGLKTVASLRDAVSDDVLEAGRTLLNSFQSYSTQRIS